MTSIFHFALFDLAATREGRHRCMLAGKRFASIKGYPLPRMACHQHRHAVLFTERSVEYVLSKLRSPSKNRTDTCLNC